jgi:uncharacterized Zn finger protein (UPF0148 family)
MPQNFDEDSARREFQRSPALQAEFGTLDVYTAYARGVASGRIIPPVCGRTVTAEAQPRREVDEQASPPVRGVSSSAARRQRQALASRDAAQRQEVENRSAALPGPRVTQRATVPDLRGIWQAHGPQAGRVQGTSSMSRFKDFQEFEQHVANHSTEGTTHGR